MILEAKHISKSYGELQVLLDVSLTIDSGEIISIVGASGAGKSTLLHILGTLDQPDSGDLIINDTKVHELSANEIAAFRNQQIGFIFQFHHLLPEFTALENVCIPGFIQKRNTETVNQEAVQLLEILGVADRKDHKPSELSGGEQQRVAVARALINKPSIVLADEPSGNLDRSNSTTLYNLMSQLRTELDQSFLIVTHDEELAHKADRTLHMIDGEMVSLAHDNFSS